MKIQIRLVGVLCWIVFLTGCFGFVPTGLEPAKPYLHHWEKPGMTLEQRRQDSVSCGASGDSSDRAGIGSTRIKTAQRPGETEKATETRLRQDWVECMKAKGYRYAK